MIRKSIYQAKAYLEKEKYLFGKSAGIFIIQALGVATAFIANLIIVKMYGEEIYGVYAGLSNWMFFLVMVCGWGLDDYFVARLPVLQVQGKLRLIRQVFFNALCTVTATWLVLVLAIFIFRKFAVRLLHIDGYLLRLVCAAVLALSVYTMLIAFLRGLKEVAIGQFAERIIRPVLLLALVGILYLIGGYRHIGSLLWVWVINFTLLAIGCGVAINRMFPFMYAGKLTGRLRLLHQPSAYFFINTVFSTLAVRIDIYMLSLMQLPVTIGYYNIAQKYADVVLYPIMIINLLLPAYLSKFNYLNEKNKVYNLIKTGSAIMLAGTAVLFIITVIMGKFLFALYGKNFLVAFPSYLFIAASHFFTAFTGPINAFILVSGREKYALRMKILHAVATGFFCYAAISFFGITGAAIGSFCGTILYSGVVIIYFYKIFHVVITPFKVFYFGLKPLK